MDYKKNTLLKDRINDSTRILKKYPNHVPIIVECCEDINKVLKRRKFLVPGELFVSHLLYSIRKQITDENSSKAIFIFSDKILLCSTHLLSVVYNEYKIRNKINDSCDNFMYIYLQYENTFG